MTPLVCDHPSMEHHVELVEGLAVAGMWSGVCQDCGAIIGDNASKEATEREALQHEAEPEPPQLEPWTPDKHPVPGFRMR